MAKGTIYEYSGSFYVRYSVGTTLSEKSGKLRPVQKTHRLCEKSDKFYSIKAAAVKRLRDEFMLTVTHRQQLSGEDMSVAAFWEQRYLPYCKEVLQLTGRPRKKPSTIRGYKQIWHQHLKSHFRNITLQESRSQSCTPCLTSRMMRLPPLGPSHHRFGHRQCYSQL
jgi:hypothetical protein